MGIDAPLILLNALNVSKLPVYIFAKLANHHSNGVDWVGSSKSDIINSYYGFIEPRSQYASVHNSQLWVGCNYGRYYNYLKAGEVVHSANKEYARAAWEAYFTG